MARYSVLVDAGYLYAAAGDLCCHTSRRGDLLIDPEKTNLFLKELCGNHCDQPHLRTYWYDGAPDAVPTREHLEFANQKGVKIRLGRLTQHGQKGVDSRIVRDLIVLSRNGAVGTVYLLSGDEDVREGVAEAQEQGVRVVLLGVEPLPGRRNQAPTLVQEADDVLVLSRTDCERFLKRRSGTPDALTPPITVESTKTLSAEDYGIAYGRSLRERLAPDKIASILSEQPSIPKHIDGFFLKKAGNDLGNGWIEVDADKKKLREGFWKGFGQTGETEDP